MYRENPDTGCDACHGISTHQKSRMVRGAVKCEAVSTTKMTLNLWFTFQIGQGT